MPKKKSRKSLKSKAKQRTTTRKRRASVIDRVPTLI